MYVRARVYKNNFLIFKIFEVKKSFLKNFFDLYQEYNII